MADKLTDQQRQAVFDRGGRLLVSAAAGSGKTRVLVERLMQYITDPQDPANIDDFLIITYTKAAASELRGKISKALTQRIAENPEDRRLQQQFQRLYLAKISTVHSFCTDVLREYAYMLDIPGDFRMIEEQEDVPLRHQVLDSLLAETYDRIGEEPEIMAFVDTQGVGRNDQLVPELILQVYDSAKCHMNSEEWLQKCESDADVSGITDPGKTIWGKYLMDSLFDTVDLYLEVVDKSSELCASSEGLSKFADILRSVSAQLRVLRAAETWDDVHRLRNIDYGSLNSQSRVKNMDKDVYEMAKLVRSHCSKELGDRLADFENDSAQVISDLAQIAPAVRGLLTLVRRFSLRYDSVKRGMRVMDFSDLEHKTLDLLLGKSRGGPTSVAVQIGRRYREIMVDEYQDSNEVQDAIFTALTWEKNNLFMVGDVKQSIYQFRLADPGIFLAKYNSYVNASDAKPGQGRRVVLSNNFRSCKSVIEAVNSVFRPCMSPEVGGLYYGDEEALWEGAPKGDLPDREVELLVSDVDSDTYSEEAELVADRICQLLDGSHMVRCENGLRPIVPEDIVILLRSPKTNAMFYRYALVKRGYQTVSSHNVDLLSTDEVDWLRSLLQTINNPRQDIPLIASMTGPVFGIGADLLAKIRVCGKGSFYDALCVSELPEAVHYLAILDKLRQTARLHSLPELIETIFELTSAKAIYGAMPDGAERKANLQDFYEFVVEFASVAGTDLYQLLRYLQQSEEKGLLSARNAANGGCIQITSIHKSKGLEYPVVFLCGLSRLFNMRSASGTLLCDQDLGLGLSCVEHVNRTRYPSIANRAISRKKRADSISEELRILYVAMTRPVDRLIMTYSSSGIDKTLYDLGVRMELFPGRLITSRATCLGSWVLYSAMMRTEAGELFRNGFKPSCSVVSDYPWNIAFYESKAVQDEPVYLTEEASTENSCIDVDQIRTLLSFQYAHISATTVPSKQTATQKKGRVKDQEASDNAPPQKNNAMRWRKPSFIEQSVDAATIGTAYHAVMQYLCYEKCCDPHSVRQQLGDLVLSGSVSEEQASMVDVHKISALFASDIGCRLRTGKRVLREFKFSILDDAGEYGQDLEGEKVLLQGVVDCAILDDDGITVVDFKSDRIWNGNVEALVERYREQVRTYADALSRIFELPVKEKLLYFFDNSQFYPV